MRARGGIRVARGGRTVRPLALALLLAIPLGAAAREASPPSPAASAPSPAHQARNGSPDSAASPAAQALEQGRAALAAGALEEAIERLAESARLFGAARQPDGRAAALLELGEAQRALGRYGAAVGTLEAALALAPAATAPARRAAILGALGNAHLALDASRAPEARRAAGYLTEAASLARGAGEPAAAAAVLVNLGNQLAFSGEGAEALARYEEAAGLARGVDPALEAKALANAARVALERDETARALPGLDRAEALARALPDSRERAYLLTSLGRAEAVAAGRDGAERAERLRRAVALLTEAADTAERLPDPLAASWAWGYLGELYESRGRVEEALRLTQRALETARQAGASESLYRWQWQAGRLLARAGELAPAAEAYGEAVATLEGMRHELAVSYGPRDPFAEVLRPVYYGRVDLLLRLARAQADAGARRALLAEARRTVEQLKRAEIRDYFRDECVDALRTKEVPLDEVSPTAAIVYPMLLPDRTELIVSVAGELRQYVVPVGAAELTREIRALRQFLEKRTTHQYLAPARQLYDWLVRPYEAELAAAGVDTLVVVPDGPLRTVPLGALHDGERFLVARYAVATTPGLDLIEPRPLDRSRLKALVTGLSESVQGFAPLEFVPEELASVHALYPGHVLLDEGFRRAALERELEDPALNVVHIASHGQFGGEAEETFLLTFDERLSLDALDSAVGLFRFRDRPLELLTLSACETAAGDDRAALGLAGVAVKAGARSVLATLWTVSDRASAELVSDFYRELQDPAVSRAAALQRAQLALLEDPSWRHPAYWAAFVLISGWL